MHPDNRSIWGQTPVAESNCQRFRKMHALKLLVLNAHRDALRRHELEP